MRKMILVSLQAAALFATISIHAQVVKIDTTVKQGTLSYRVACNNKNETDNSVSISPKGFGKDIRDVSFTIRGRLKNILVEDLNSDGYPDLLLCVYSGANGTMGNIIGIACSGNTALVPIVFPDIYSDPKLREGYKGHDEFTVMIGTLMQSFPVYKPGDTNTPTGGTRVIQYKVTNGTGGNLTFKVLRFYEKNE